MTAEAKLLSDEQIASIQYRADRTIGCEQPLNDRKNLLSHIAALTEQNQMLEEQWAVMARACGNWREWPNAIGKDKTEDDWQAGARAIIERDELQAQLDAARQEAEQAKQQLAALSAPGEAGVEELAKQLRQEACEIAGVEIAAWSGCSKELQAKWRDLASRLSSQDRKQVAELEAENTRLEQELACRCETCCAHKSLPCNHCKAPKWHCQMCCELAQLRQRAEGAEKELRDKKSEISSLRTSLNANKSLRAELRECQAIRNVQYNGLRGAETFIEAMHTELFMVEMDSDDKARLQDLLKDAAREISSTMGRPTRQILIKQEYEIADLEKQLAEKDQQIEVLSRSPDEKQHEIWNLQDAVLKAELRANDLARELHGVKEQLAAKGGEGK